MAGAADLDTSTKLAMLLASLGSSLQNSGGNVWQGLSGGVNNYFAGMGAYGKQQQDQQEKQALMDHYKAQSARLDAQTALERRTLDNDEAARRAYSGMGVPSTPQTPGMAAPPQMPTMGPGGGSFLDRWSTGESGNNPQATNPSGAGGLFQFMPQTWSAARAAIPGLPDSPTQATPPQQAQAAEWYKGQATSALTGSLGRQPTPGEVGLSTLAGPAGASALLKLDPNTPIASLPQDFWQRMGEKFTHQTFLAQNPQIAQLGTVGNVADFFRKRFEGGGGISPVGTAPYGQPQTAGIVPIGAGNGAPPSMRDMQPAQAGAGLPDVTGTDFGQGAARPPGMSPMQGPQPQGAMAPPQAAPDAGPPMVSRPSQVPPEIKSQLQRMVASRQLTIPQAVAEENKYLDTMWTQQQANARSTWEFNRGAGTTQTLSPDEVKRLGLPEGTVAQRARDGGVSIVNKPAGYTIKELGDGNTYLVDTMNPSKQPIPLGPPKAPDPKEIDQVRGQIEKLPTVAAVQVVAPVFNSMIKSAAINSKAADLDMIYGLAKVLDPNSVVREGEMEMVKRTGGVFDQIQGWLSSVNAGGALPPDVRASIMQIAANRVAELKAAADAAMKPYIGIAQDRGWKIEHVMPGIAPIGTFDPATVATTPRPQGGPGAPPTAPPQQAIDRLRANPGERDKFDAVFGKGAADKALGGR